MFYMSKYKSANFYSSKDFGTRIYFPKNDSAGNGHFLLYQWSHLSKTRAKPLGRSPRFGLVALQKFFGIRKVNSLNRVQLGGYDTYRQVIRRPKKDLKVIGIKPEDHFGNNSAKQYRLSVPLSKITIDRAMVA